MWQTVIQLQIGNKRGANEFLNNELLISRIALGKHFPLLIHSILSYCLQLRSSKQFIKSKTSAIASCQAIIKPACTWVGKFRRVSLELANFLRAMPWLSITASSTGILSNHVSSVSQCLLCWVPILSANTLAQQLDTLLTAIPLWNFKCQCYIALFQLWAAHCHLCSTLQKELHGCGSSTSALIFHRVCLISAHLCGSVVIIPAVLWDLSGQHTVQLMRGMSFHNPINHCSCSTSRILQSGWPAKQPQHWLWPRRSRFL